MSNNKSGKRNFSSKLTAYSSRFCVGLYAMHKTAPKRCQNGEWNPAEQLKWGDNAIKLKRQGESIPGRSDVSVAVITPIVDTQRHTLRHVLVTRSSHSAAYKRDDLHGRYRLLLFDDGVSSFTAGCWEHLVVVSQRCQREVVVQWQDAETSTVPVSITACLSICLLNNAT